MAAARRRRRRSAGYTVTQDPAKIGPFLRSLGFVGTKADPIDSLATFDAMGELRTVCSRYPDGWSCRLRMRRDWTYSLTQTFRVVMRAELPC